MVKRLGAILVLMCLVLTCRGTAALSPEDAGDLEAFFDGVFAIQQRQYKVPGIAVAVVKDGEVLFAKGYGHGDLEAGQAVDPAYTLFRAGSNTKVLVWTAVMQLVEAGELDLHRDINEYLDFQIPGQLHSGAQAPPITLHHLLTHTAGFEEVISETFVLSEEDSASRGIPAGAHACSGCSTRHHAGLLQLWLSPGRLHCRAGFRHAFLRVC